MMLADLGLPPPDMSGEIPLMVALERRRSTREFATRPLPDNVLSNLLWAANGINRPETGGRTAATACNWQEIDIYVIRPEGFPPLYKPAGACFDLCAQGRLLVLSPFTHTGRKQELTRERCLLMHRWVERVCAAMCAGMCAGMCANNGAPR